MAITIPMLKWSALLVMVVAVGGCSVFGKSGVETPDYQVLKSSEPFEIRRYAPMRVAETTAIIPDNGKGSIREPFMRLFRYIDGGNDGSNKIAMTAPVLMTPDDSQADQQAMAFVLPKAHQDAPPKPTSAAVSIKDRPAQTVAAISFTGSRSADKAREQEALLRDWLTDQGLEATGPAVEAYYNPPWTIPFLRRNEVLIPLKEN